ncbi:Hypothetical protein, putative [Bodo saltans]|uniref:Uncharacterized protein n=1 Tax=Bodo saltans TaxID=75058 RepID=A0A0S4JT50_BODSA|nr:Hypothetical protein, putative [Bodo saltans]|eukprot:CUG91736.1 Hypothetical protein, putative [Bodo saltans]
MLSKAQPLLTIAVDAEFLKMGGVLTARSAAFVPFSPLNPKAAVAPSSSVASTVVQMDASFVAQYCDLLPAGYSLRDHCVEFAKGLEQFFPPVERRMHSHHALRKFVQLTDGMQQQQPNDSSATGGVEEDTSSSTPSSASSSMPQSVDPYMVPNSQQFLCVGGLGALYREAPTSDAFQQIARRLVSKTVLYGPSKVGTPAIGALVKRDSVRFQQFLRHRFSSEEEWVNWVETAHMISRKALDASTTNLSSSPSPPSTSSSSGGVDVIQCTTLAEFSRHLCNVWSSYMQHQKGVATKFYSYGGADVGVLRAAAHLGCAERKSPKEQGQGVGLRSPMQITLTDVTKLPAFRAMGFEREVGLTPRLRHALEKVRTRNPEAESLLRNPDEHNPLWDAAALAALCQVVLHRW